MAHRTTVLLGAGASRAVSYAGKRAIRSPLDADFFELLQKVEAKDKDETAVSDLIHWILAVHSPVWNSMEGIAQHYILPQIKISLALDPRLPLAA
jgi:hypothetical protein